MLERFVRNIIEKEGKKSVVEIPVDSISVNPYQPRRFFDEKRLHELSQSIREQGIIQPIIVRRLAGGYELVAGERRLRASKMIDMKTIPAIVRDLDDQDMVEIAFIENLQREQLSDFEEAEAYGRLMQEQSLTTPESVGARVGKDTEQVKEKLWMLSLPPVIKKAVVSRLISIDHARLLAQVAGEKKQVELLERIYREKMGVAETRKLLDTMPGILRQLAPETASESSPPLIYSQDSLRQIDACVSLLREMVITFRRAGVPVEVTESFDSKNLHIRLAFPVEHRPA